MIRTVIQVAAIGAASLLLEAGGVTAQEESAWATRCIATSMTGPMRCGATHRILAQNGQLMFQVALDTRQGQQGADLSVRGPLGIHLPAGLSFSLDGAVAYKLRFQSCTSEGCFASSILSAEQVKELARARSLQISFQANDQSEGKVDVPTHGLADALRRIQD